MSCVLLNSLQMKECDLNAINKGIKSSLLMEKAGTSISKEIIKRLEPCKTLVLCSDKGNGGDGYVVARILKDNGFDVTVYEVSSNFSLEAKEKHDLCTAKIVKEYPADTFSLIVDALVGIGLKTTLRSNFINIVSKVNLSKSFVVSVDIASGLSSDNGLTLGASIKSDLTVAVSNYKLGHFLHDGPDSYKELVLVDIGIENIIPNSVLKYTLNDFLGVFRKRPSNVNKGSFKRSTIIAGSLEASGASELSYLALSSLLLGSGYSSLATTTSLMKKALFVNPEVMLRDLGETKFGCIRFNKKKLDEIMSSSASIGIGMGLLNNKETYKTIKYLLENYNKRLLIDADGLNSLSKYGLEILKNKTCEVVLTPHIKEFSRLLNLSVKDVLNDRVVLAKKFANEYNITLVLKSNTTLIASKDNTALTAAGSSALAKGGSGDTLSGIITGLLTYNYLSVFDASILGTIILGEASNTALEDNNMVSLLSSNVIKCIPNVISLIIKKTYKPITKNS